MVCNEFPGSLVVYREKAHSDRIWNDDPLRPDYPSCYLPSRVFLPKIGCLHPGLLPLILHQPRRVIHLIGACGGGDRYLLHGIGQCNKGILVEWNDGGFPEQLSPSARLIMKRILAPRTEAAFAPGRIGCHYFRVLGIREDRIFNAYFSHDVDEYDYRRRQFYQEYREAVRARLGIPRRDFVLLNVSRFLDLKRLEDLHEALCRIQSKARGDLHLILIGKGHHRKPLEDMQNGLCGIRLHWLERVDYADMPEFYAAADLMVFPSEGDIWGLVVNEALSMGVPVICTNRIGAAQLIREGVDGFTVPPRRADLIGERILQIYGDPGLHGFMRRRAVEICQRWNSRLAIGELHKMVDFLEKTNPGSSSKK